MVSVDAVSIMRSVIRYYCICMHVNEIMMMLFLQLCISPTVSQREEGELVTDTHFVLKTTENHCQILILDDCNSVFSLLP